MEKYRLQQAINGRQHHIISKQNRSFAGKSLLNLGCFSIDGKII